MALRWLALIAFPGLNGCEGGLPRPGRWPHPGTCLHPITRPTSVRLPAPSELLGRLISPPAPVCSKPSTILGLTATSQGPIKTLTPGGITGTPPTITAADCQNWEIVWSSSTCSRR